MIYWIIGGIVAVIIVTVIVAVLKITKDMESI